MRITAQIDLTLICPTCGSILCRNEFGRFYCGNKECPLNGLLFRNIYAETEHFTTLENIKNEKDR